MKLLLAPFALLACASSAAAQDTTPAPQLTAQQSASLRCSAAFAMVAEGQANGNADALAFPPLAERGREFFVRSTAQLMDELGLDREGIRALVAAEAQQLWDEGAIEAVMPGCLLLLDASGI